MSENQEHHDEGHHGAGHGIGHYKKIYFLLLGLLVVSVVGPFVGDATGLIAITLITAFGIAVYKANLVIQNFMHLKAEKRLAKWVLATSLLLMALMFAGISADVMNHEGRNWVNIAAQAAVERGIDGVEEVEEVEFVAAGFNVESMFNIVCASCHGTAGDGTGAAGAALDPSPANFTDPAFWAERDMDRIVNVIANGAGAVGGSILMVGWSASFDEEQIQEFADYVAEFRPEQ